MTPQRLTDAELKEALEVAGKATPGEWIASRLFADWNFPHVNTIETPVETQEIQLRYGGKVLCFQSGPNSKLNAQSNADAAHIATMNPEFASRLIKEVIWARNMLHDAFGIIGGYSQLDRSKWLEVYEKGPG